MVTKKRQQPPADVYGFEPFARTWKDFWLITLAAVAGIGGHYIIKSIFG